MMYPKAPALTPTVYICVDASTVPTPQPQRVLMKRGRTYELRCDADVLVRPGQGQASSTDIRVRPDAPLLFTADVDEARVRAATSTTATVWVREVLE